MTAIPSGGNYLSDEAIMMWVAQKQNDMYADLGGAIDVSTKRAELTDDLNNIKAELRDANDKGDFSKVDADLQAFMNKYGADPEFADTCKGIDDLAKTVHDGATAQARYEVDHAKWVEKNAAFDAKVTAAITQSTDPFQLAQKAAEATADAPGNEPTKPVVQHYDDHQMDTWKELISGKIDNAGRNDQLNMIHVQELKGQIDQSTQLASALISGSQKASEGILHNIA